MIQLFRKFSQSIYAKVLFAVLVVAMAMFALPSMQSSPFSNAAITAGTRETSPEEFKRIFDNARKQQEQRARRPIPVEEMITAGFHRRIANELAEQNSFLSWLDSIRMTPGDILITDSMRRERAFLNPVTGAFDKTQFLRVLGENGMTEARYQRETRDQIMMMHFGSGMAMGLRAPRIFGAMQAAYALERRDVSIFAVTPQMVGIPEKPTDAQLTAFIKENQAELRRPEFRQLTLVLFTAASVGGQITVPEATIQQDFAARSASMAQAERRTFVQIPVATPEVAQRVVAGLRAGQDPAAVARSVNAQAITFTDKPQTAVPDAAVARAAFSLAQGQVSEPIRGALGMAVVKVTAIAPGHAVTLEEARPEIEARLRGELAGEKVYEAVEKFEAARTAGKPLTEAARIAGARVVTLPAPVSETGLAPNGQRLGAANMDSVFEAAFALAPGGESETAEDLGNGEYFAVRVDRIIPAGLLTIAANRPELNNRWMIKELDRRLKAKADQLAARVRAGESITAVAASAGGELRNVAGLPRQPNPSLGQMVQEIFLQKAGDVFTGQLPGSPQAPLRLYAVGRINAIHTPPPAVAARIVEAQRPQVSDGLARDMAQLASAAAKIKVKPKVRVERIDAAVGVTPPEDAPAGKKK